MQIAFQQRRPRLLRMHVSIDDSRHQKSSHQVNDYRVAGDERRKSLIISDINDLAVADRQCLNLRMRCIGGEDDPVPIHTISRAGRRRCDDWHEEARDKAMTKYWVHEMRA